MEHTPMDEYKKNQTETELNSDDIDIDIDMEEDAETEANIKPDEDTEIEEDIDAEVRVIEVKHRTSSKQNSPFGKTKHKKKDVYDYFFAAKDFLSAHKRIILSCLAVLFVLIMVVAGTKSCKKNHSDATPTDAKHSEKQVTPTDSKETETAAETETTPALSIEALPSDSELTTLISNFYQAYVISGSKDEVAKYIDSVNGIEDSTLSINKKYIETVSDFTCYESAAKEDNSSYRIMIVTYKMKLYNYDELLPAIDILFVTEGDNGYRIHNQTVGDQFDAQKIMNDNDYQILKQQTSDELNKLLSANADLKEVYDFYLNPAKAESES